MGSLESGRGQVAKAPVVALATKRSVPAAGSVGTASLVPSLVMKLSIQEAVQGLVPSARASEALVTTRVVLKESVINQGWFPLPVIL